MTCCWLWAEYDRIRWWTPDATGFLNSNHPHPNGMALGNWANLRDGVTRSALRHALQPELVEVLESALTRQAFLSMKLANDLPTIWQQYPFEWLRFQGSPLQGRLLVERYVPRRAIGGIGFFERQVAVLNLWPDNEVVQPFNDLGRLPHVDVYFGPDISIDFMARNDLTRISLLIIVSHGTENHDGPPFRLGNGEAWELTLQYGIPTLVLLVACGNEQGNLISYGKTLLENGAKTVIAPVGQLDAESAARFLKNFLTDWSKGVRLDQILLEQPGRAENTHAGWRFCLLGQSNIRIEAPQSAEEWSDQKLAKATREPLVQGDNPEALLTLIERITLRCYQESGTLEAAENYMRDSGTLAIPYGHAVKEPELLNGLDSHIEQLSLLSKAWVLPLLGALCEAHNHLLLSKYDRLCRDRSQFKETPASADHYLSKIPYRLGHYTKSAESVLAGFEKLPNSCSSQQSIRLLGQLLNLLTDLNLTPNGIIVSRSLGNHLTQYTGADSETLQIYSLDRQARLALRKGEPDTALELFILKRRKVGELPDACLEDRSGLRELAWLLYTASWKNPSASEASYYAKEVQQALKNPDEVMANTLGGNTNSVYLMRALALWCWRANDRNTAELLIRYSNFWRNWLDSDRDAGPIGFAVWFMHLYYLDKSLPFAFPRLEKAEVKLYADNYLLELATLSVLLGKKEKAREYLCHFQTSRQDTLNYFDRLPSWLGLKDWVGLAEKQTDSESQFLLHKSTVTPEMLVTTGLLPLRFSECSITAGESQEDLSGQNRITTFSPIG